MSLRKGKSRFKLEVVGVLTLLCVGLFVLGANAYANSTSLASSHQPAQVSSLTVNSGPATWITHASELNGKVVHFYQISSSYIKGSHSLADGRKVLGNIWELIDPHGQVAVFHGIYTSIDGKTFYQEILKDASTSTVVFSKNTPGLSATWLATHQCVLQSKVSVIEQSSSLLPMFVDEAAIKADGFSMIVGKLAQSPVTTPPLSNVSPLKTYNASGAVQIWTEVEHLQGSLTRTQQEEVSSQNRALVMGSKIVDQSGIILNSTWTEFSSMYVYDPSVVPPSVFSVQQFRGGCAQ